ncbi:MAG TPA: tetratricopeptide repeat protein, partial [Sphingomonas sp.]|nr:tetratricopeptide repeat protein [Sphingomonas sp.]
MARRILTAAPDAVMPRLTLGAALRRCGDPRGALDVLDPLVAALPAAWGLHYERGIAHAALDQNAAATDALTLATQYNPLSSLAWHALTDQLHLLGRPDAAAAAAKARVLPGGAGDAAVIEAARLLFDGAPSAAEHLQTRFGFDPNDIAVLRLLAEIAVALGNDRTAERLLAKALHLAPDFMPAHYHHAALLYRLARFVPALASANRVAEARPTWPEAKTLRAAIRMRGGDARSALADLEAALAIDPGEAQAWHAYGHALRAVGRPAEAVEAYRRAIAAAPTFTEAFWSLANLKTWRFEDQDMARMDRLLSNPDLGRDDQSYLHFALG